MGCTWSSDMLSNEDDEEAPPAAKSTGYSVDKAKQSRRRRSRKKRSVTKKKLPDVDVPREPAENTKIYVIWRRCSVFSSRRESSKSSKSQDLDAAGPSQGANSRGEPAVQVSQRVTHGGKGRQEHQEIQNMDRKENTDDEQVIAIHNYGQ